MNPDSLLFFEPDPWFYFFSFTILGGGIKYVDEAFDRKAFSKPAAIVTAVGLGVLWATTMLADRAAATILLAVMLGVLLSGKIDNVGHIAGCIVIIALLLLGGVQIQVWPLAALTGLAIADEFGNDYVDDKNSRNQWTGPGGRTIKCLFGLRCMMKIGVLALTAVGMLPWYLFGAFLLFDGAYITVRHITKARLRRQKVPVPSSTDK